jgi:hypothetical protein
VKFLKVFQNFTRFKVVKFGTKTHINKKNWRSVMIINTKFRFEPCVINLI